MSAATTAFRRSSRLASIAKSEEIANSSNHGVTCHSEVKLKWEKRRALDNLIDAELQENKSSAVGELGNDERSNGDMDKKPVIIIRKTHPRPKAAKAPKKSLKMLPSRNMEVELWEMGFKHVAGIDEAGRGPLAGPVVAAACIIPSYVSIEGIDDSKKLSQLRREELYDTIISTPGVAYAIHVIDAAMIDKVNILQATMLAMTGCINKLNMATGASFPDFILIDGNRLPDGLQDGKARAVIKGDAECFVIAAASILAKVTRDQLMMDYDKKWPEYGFKAHKGYGTIGHMAALLKHGPCEIHRRSFAPLKDQHILKGVRFA